MTVPPLSLSTSRRVQHEQKSVILKMDLDSFLQSELDNINDMFEEFKTQDQEHEKRTRDEEKKIMTKVS